MSQFNIFGNLENKKVKASPSLKPAKPLDLSQFNYEPEVTYIGQNLYIRPNYVISMPEYSVPRKFDSEKFLANKANLKDNKHKGKVSVKAMKEIKNSVNWLIHAAKFKRIWHKESKRYYNFKVNFITLTLPDTPHTIDAKAFKADLLEPFLAALRKGYGLLNYVWKLEYQSNGKLHAHLTTDTFIYWKDVRRLWNLRLIKCGYMSLFKAQHGHSDPNSTDIHSVRVIKDLAAYIAKYMAKDSDQLSSCSGRIWGCNYEISRNRKPSVFIDRHSGDLSIKSLFNKFIHFSPLTIHSDITKLPRTIGEIFFLSQSCWRKFIRGSIRECYDSVIRALQREPDLFESCPVV